MFNNYIIKKQKTDEWLSYEENIELNTTKPKYKIFYGNLRITIPQLINEGRRPITVSEILNARVASIRDTSSVMSLDSWWNHDLHTGSVSFYGVDGSVKIVSSSNFLSGLNKDSSNDCNYGWLLSENSEKAKSIFENIEGDYLTFEELKYWRKRHHSITKSMLLENPIWNALADKKTLSDYFDVVSYLQKGDVELPQISFPSHPLENYSFLPIRVGSLIDGCAGLNTYLLGSENDNIIGVLDELDDKISTERFELN